MVTISTATEAEALAISVVMTWAPPDLDYEVYLLGRAYRPENVRETDGAV